MHVLFVRWSKHTSTHTSTNFARGESEQGDVDSCTALSPQCARTKGNILIFEQHFTNTKLGRLVMNFGGFFPCLLSFPHCIASQQRRKTVSQWASEENQANQSIHRLAVCSVKIYFFPSFSSRTGKWTYFSHFGQKLLLMGVFFPGGVPPGQGRLLISKVDGLPSKFYIMASLRFRTQGKVIINVLGQMLWGVIFVPFCSMWSNFARFLLVYAYWCWQFLRFGINLLCRWLVDDRHF